MDKEVEGIILYTTDFKESSQVLQILTKEYGLIGAIARGSKKIKSKFLNKTTRYNYAKFYINYRENSLSVIKEIDIIDSYSFLHTDITLISYLNYLCNLTYQVAKQDNNKEILELLLTALQKINNGLDALVITNIIELKYLKYLGITINLDACCKCGSQKNIVTLNAKEGGYICKNCYQNEMLVGQNTIKMLRLYNYIDLKKISTVKVDKITKMEINLFLSNYYDTYTGLYLKSKEFLNKIIAES